VQTPRFCGQDCKAGDFVLDVTFCRPKRTNWLIVGIRQKLLISQQKSRFEKHNPNTNCQAPKEKQGLKPKFNKMKKKDQVVFEKKRKNSPHCRFPIW
jgi:hypothetical protein